MRRIQIKMPENGIGAGNSYSMFRKVKEGDMNHRGPERSTGEWRLISILLSAVLSLPIASCAPTAGGSDYFGRTKPPEGQVLRYVSGPEPESLDPQVVTGQPEIRIDMALFEGLAEYDPKTMQPIPAVASRWDVSGDASEFIFYLRKNARWSNNEPITAQDFVYSWRRALSPELASRSAYLAYYIKYAQGYNEGGVFVRDPSTGEFLLEKDVKPDSAKPQTPSSPRPLAMPSKRAAVDHELSAPAQTSTLDSPFHRFIVSPGRLVLSGSEKTRAKEIEANPKLKAVMAGKELVPVKAEDIGVEAVDDYTFRVTLAQPAPFFISLVPHPLLRAVPRRSIERHKAAWTQPENMITSGPFKLQAWEPYDQIIVTRDPNYWDAAHVRLDKIVFYALDDVTTMMNLYKTGEVDAVANHNVPSAWIDVIRPLKDYMDAPEAGIQYYLINVTKPPMNDVRVRRAFNMAVDKLALSRWRRVAKPLTAFTPEGIFPGYPQPRGDDFDPGRARQLLAAAGYRDKVGNFAPEKFPIDQVEIIYNTNDSNRAVAEFVQAQWKQNLGLTVPLRNMETKTFLDARAKLEYQGFARTGYGADYLDPLTFLNLFYTPGGDNGTGWWDAKYARMLDEANRRPDAEQRYRLLAKAEAYLLEAQPFIPLYTNATNWMKKPYVKGLYPNPGTLHAWKFVYIEPDQAQWDRGVPKMVD